MAQQATKEYEARLKRKMDELAATPATLLGIAGLTNPPVPAGQGMPGEPLPQAVPIPRQDLPVVRDVRTPAPNPKAWGGSWEPQGALPAPQGALPPPQGAAPGAGIDAAPAAQRALPAPRPAYQLPSAARTMPPLETQAAPAAEAAAGEEAAQMGIGALPGGRLARVAKMLIPGIIAAGATVYHNYKNGQGGAGAPPAGAAGGAAQPAFANSSTPQRPKSTASPGTALGGNPDQYVKDDAYYSAGRGGSAQDAAARDNAAAAAGSGKSAGSAPKKKGQGPGGGRRRDSGRGSIELAGILGAAGDTLAQPLPQQPGDPSFSPQFSLQGGNDPEAPPSDRRPAAPGGSVQVAAEVRDGNTTKAYDDKDRRLVTAPGYASGSDLTGMKEDGYGQRPDGTQKGNGWLGPIRRPDGTVMTEVSVGVNIGGKEMDVPTLVPTLSPQEVDYLKKAPIGPQTFQTPIGRQIVMKAQQHAEGRVAQGLSPFADTPQPRTLQGIDQPAPDLSPAGRNPALDAAGVNYNPMDPKGAQGVTVYRGGQGRHPGEEGRGNFQDQAQRGAESTIAKNAAEAHYYGAKNETDLATTKMNADAHKYASDNLLAGTRYAADKGLEGHRVTAGATIEAARIRENGENKRAKAEAKQTEDRIKILYGDIKKLNLPEQYTGQHFDLARLKAATEDTSTGLGLYYNPGTPGRGGIVARRADFDPLVNAYLKKGYPQTDAIANAFRELDRIQQEKGVPTYVPFPNLDRLPDNLHKIPKKEQSISDLIEE